MASPITPRQPRQSDRKRGQGKNFSTTYTDYIAGAAWADRKKRYYSTHAKVCKACGTTQHIQLHHLTYKRLGDELDADLMPLCHKHHQAVEEFKHPNNTIAQATWEMVEWVSTGVRRQVIYLPPARSKLRKPKKKRTAEHMGMFDRNLPPGSPAKKPHTGQNPKRGVTGADALNYSNRRPLRTDNGL